MRVALLAGCVMVLSAIAACSGLNQPGSNPISPSGAVAAKPGGGAIAITAALENLDSTGLPADVTSDGLGAYVHGAGGVSSTLLVNAYNNLANGDWEIDARDSTSRRARYTLDPADAVQPGDPAFLVPAMPPFWGTEAVRFHMQVKCTFVNHSMKTMAAGTSFTCPLLQHLRRDDNTEFGLQAAKTFTGFGETTDVQVVCNSTDAAGCNDWFIEPIQSTYGGQAIARLMLMQETLKPRRPNVHVGTFYIRFRIHLTRP